MKCLLFGLGQAGMAALGLLEQRGADIVGVFTQSSHLGADYGVLAGGPPSGRQVQPVSAFVPHRGMADVALFFTTSSVESLLTEPLLCLAAGINVLTIAEQALFPWKHAPSLCDQLDAAAKTGGATISATGVNDTVMCHLPAIVAGIVPDARAIEVVITGDYGALGPNTLRNLPLGMTAREFASTPVEAHDPQATTCGQVMEAMLALCGLSSGAVHVDVEPTFAVGDIHVPTIGRTIPAGSTSGLLEIARTTADSGTEITIKLYGKLFEPGEEEYLHVSIAGTVPLELDLRPLPSIATTAAIAIGRIPDVIAAPPGYVTTDKFPTARWRPNADYG